MKFKEPERSFIEHVVVVVVVLVVAFLVGATIYYQRQDTQQKALFYQLQIIRSSINLFKIVDKRNPHNLIEVATGFYKFPGDVETKKYLTNVPFDREGNIIDPFGRPYLYDSATGWVRSGTSGYEMW
jgi:type II secretory pathway pseudopilin PulG